MVQPLILFSSFLVFSLAVLTSPLAATGCFDPSPLIRPAIFAECISVINLIPIIVRDPNLPLKFSEDPAQRPDIELPVFWRDHQNKCVVNVDIKDGQTGYDRSSLHDIAEWAKAVALECIIRPPHLGGSVTVGWHRKMSLTVGKLDPLSKKVNGSLATS